MIEERAERTMTPTIRLPAALDPHEAATACVIPISPVPPHDTTGDGGRNEPDAHTTSAAIPTPTIQDGPGHDPCDPQRSNAGAEDVEREEVGQRRRDAQIPDADLARLHALLGHYARQLWDAQEQRIAAGNRVAAMERDGLGAEAEPARAVVKEYEAIERGIDRELTKLARQHFMAPWIAEQRGIGLPGFARILGVTGSLDRFATVSRLWKYLGLHVVDGHAPRREKGVSWTHTDCGFWHLRACKPDCTTDHHPNCVPGGVGTAYAPKGRVVCRQIAESIVKSGKGPTAGHWRRVYDEKKAYYEAEREDWTQARRDNAAKRYAIKMLLKEMWVEWQVRRPDGG